MPMYTYRCDKGHEFEYRQRMTEAPLTQCLTCEAPARRIVNSVGVVFKGSGFYVTDNSRNGNGNGRNANGATKKEETTSGETTSGETSTTPTENKTAESTPVTATT